MSDKVSDRQKHFEDGCRKIAKEIENEILKLPLPYRLLALANLADLFNSIRSAYTNGRIDEKDGF